MPARLRVHSIAATRPTDAAREVTTAILHDAPTGRPMLLAVVGWGAHPGLRPTPWVLDGVADAVTARGHRASVLHLGERSMLDPINARLAAAGLGAAEPSASTSALCLAGSRRSLRIPRDWLGSTLCLVVPCVHRHRRGPHGGTWQGPIAAAMHDLVEPMINGRVHEPIERIASGLADSFAHISAVIDGSWWAPLSDDDRAAPLLLSPARVLGLPLASPVTAAAAVDPRHADAWLGAQLGLPLRRRPTDPLPIIGSAARIPWPKLPRPARPARSTGLAGQALDALWRRTDRGPARRSALPPAVPGALADLWTEYRRQDGPP